MASSQSAPAKAQTIPLHIAGRRYVIVDGRLDDPKKVSRVPYEALKDARRAVLDDLGTAHRNPRENAATISELNIKLKVLEELIAPYRSMEDGRLITAQQGRALSLRESLIAHYLETGKIEPLQGVRMAFVTDIANVVYVGLIPAEVTTALATATINALTDMFESAVPIFAALTPARKAELALSLASIQEQLIASGP